MIRHHILIGDRADASLDTCAPFTSARCALISPCVSPLAESDSTMSSTPDKRRCRLPTGCGVNYRPGPAAPPARPARPRSAPSWPACRLREFPPLRSAGSCLP